MSWSLKGGAPVKAYYEPEPIRRLPPAARRARRAIRIKVADARGDAVNRRIELYDSGIITLEQLRSAFGQT
jgi:hypothetical protein